MNNLPTAERLLEDIVWTEIAMLGLAIGALYGAALPELLRNQQFLLVGHLLPAAIFLGGLAANIVSGNQENPYSAYAGFLLVCALLGGAGTRLFGFQVAGNLPLAILLGLVTSVILVCALLTVAQTILARLAGRFR